MTTLNTHVAQRMKAARQRTGYTQAELATLIGVSSVSISRWETGARTPHINDLALFAEHTNKPVAWFFLRENETLQFYRDGSIIVDNV